METTTTNTSPAIKTVKTVKTATKTIKTPKTKKPADTKVKAVADRGDRSMASDVTPGERKKLLIKVLRQKKATSAPTALPLSDLCEKLGYTQFDVYGLISGTSGKAGSNPRCLLATGHVKVAVVDEKGRGIYLTAKGNKTDFTEVPFVK